MLLVQTAAAIADSSAAAIRRLSDSVTIALLERGTEAADRNANSMGVVVGAMGVLFTALAIGTAYALYRQSRDFQARADVQIASYREIVQKVAEEARLMAATAVEGLKAEAAEVTEQLAALGSERQAERAELEKKKDQIDVRLRQLEEQGVPTVPPLKAEIQWGATPVGKALSEADSERIASVVDRILGRRRTCATCGWKQSRESEPRIARGGMLHCPRCGEYLTF